MCPPALTGYLCFLTDTKLFNLCAKKLSLWHSHVLSENQRSISQKCGLDIRCGFLMREACGAQI